MSERKIPAGSYWPFDAAAACERPRMGIAGGRIFDGVRIGAAAGATGSAASLGP